MPHGRSAHAPSRFFLLRHGQSLANVQGLIASSPAVAGDGFGLTETGRAQVRDWVSSARASGLLPAAVHLISSPLLRARETAAVAAEVLGTTVRVDARLTERSFGEFELTSDTHYERVWAVDRTDPTHERWGVESVASILGRTAALLRELDAFDGDGTFVLCTHGDVASTLICASSGLALTQHREVGALGNGELRAIDHRDIARATPPNARAV